MIRPEDVSLDDIHQYAAVRRLLEIDGRHFRGSYIQTLGNIAIQRIADLTGLPLHILPTYGTYVFWRPGQVRATGLSHIRRGTYPRIGARTLSAQIQRINRISSPKSLCIVTVAEETFGNESRLGATVANAVAYHTCSPEDDTQTIDLKQKLLELGIQRLAEEGSPEARLLAAGHQLVLDSPELSLPTPNRDHVMLHPQQKATH